MVGLKIPTIYPIAGADVVAGWRFCPQFAIGVGTGVWTMFVQNVEVPLYLHLRSDISDTRVSPYVALNAGYNFEARPAVEDLLEFGGMFTSALGLKPVGEALEFTPIVSLNVAIMF